MPLVAGLFAFPEIIAGWRRGNSIATIGEETHTHQTWVGIKAVWKYKWDALRGGAIGAFVGFLPGLGGAMGDWMSYGSTVASHPEEEFGNGNMRGVVGPEGSNNAQKATSMIPTVLFGIPGASFAAVLLGLFAYLGFELGTQEIANDTKFFDSLTFGFMWATIITGVVCVLFNKQIAKDNLCSLHLLLPILSRIYYMGLCSIHRRLAGLCYTWTHYMFRIVFEKIQV